MQSRQDIVLHLRASLGPVVLAPDVEHEHAGDEEERHHQHRHRAHLTQHNMGLTRQGGAKLKEIEPRTLEHQKEFYLKRFSLQMQLPSDKEM